MRRIKRRDPICAYYGLIDLPDPDCTCAICGNGIWADEEVEFNQNEEICHADCVEKEKENGSEETC